MSFTFLDSDDQTTQNVLSLIHMHKMVYEMPAIKKKKKELLDYILEAEDQKKEGSKSLSN